MKKILTISFTILLLGGALFLVGFMDTIHNDVVCSSMDISVVNPLEDPMVTKQEIKQVVDSLESDVVGKHLGEIDINRIEKEIRTNPYVLKAKVYSTVNGKIFIEVSQREPLIRIINSNSEQYFIDREGKIIPWDLRHPTRVMLANGDIQENFDFATKPVISLNSLSKKSVLRQLFIIAKEISKDDFSRALINQIYVDHNNEFQLLPLIGKQTIVMGDTSKLRNKLQNLKAFYTQVMSKKGWETYQTINIKFDNQVVCTKY